MVSVQRTREVNCALSSPRISPAEESGSALVGDDLAYPLMLRLLPAGILGMVVASLAGAYMSTVDTHLNWGASYAVHDVYRRFLRPDAEEILEKSTQFFRSHDNTVYHVGYPRSYRQEGNVPNIQFSVSEDGLTCRP